MGTWGPGPFQNDAALDFVGDQVAGLVATVGEFLDQPRLDSGFACAFAALELLALLVEHTAASPPEPAEIDQWRTVFLATFEREIDAVGADDDFKRDQRKALEQVFAAIGKHAKEFHRGRAGQSSSKLARALARAAKNQPDGDFAINYGDLIEWVTPFGDDHARMWAACEAGDRMVAIAQVLGVTAARLAPIVAHAM